LSQSGSKAAAIIAQPIKGCPELVRQLHEQTTVPRKSQRPLFYALRLYETRGLSAPPAIPRLQMKYLGSPSEAFNKFSYTYVTATLRARDTFRLPFLSSLPPRRHRPPLGPSQPAMPRPRPTSLLLHCARIVESLLMFEAARIAGQGLHIESFIGK
jgi:hypothetical protein